MPMLDEFDAKLYEDIDRRVRELKGAEQGRFIMDLTVLKDLTTGDQEETIRKYLNAYYVPRKKDGTLDKKLFEQHMENLEKARIERLYQPLGEYVFQNQQEHSERWIWEQVNNKTQMGMYNAGHMNNVMDFQMDREAMKALGHAYPEAEKNTRIIEETLTRKREQMLETLPEEGRKKVQEAIRYTGLEDLLKKGKTAEDLAEQRQKESRETFMDVDESKTAYAVTHYAAVRDMDLSFIRDMDRYVQIRQQIDQGSTRERFGAKGGIWEPERQIDSEMDGFQRYLTPIGEELRRLSGSRLGDSGKFNRIKDDFADLQEKLKKGNSKENREEIMKSLAKFSKDCKTYMDARKGTRRSERGNERKKLVKELQELIDDGLQIVLDPEMQPEMKEVSREMNKKLVEEQERQQPENFKKAKDSFKEKVNFKALSKEEGSKANFSKADRAAENTHMKEKGSESRRKSMGSLGK